MGENSEQCSGLMVMVTLPYGKFKGKKLLSLGRVRIHNSDCFDLNSVLLFLKSLCNGCLLFLPVLLGGGGQDLYSWHHLGPRCLCREEPK